MSINILIAFTLISNNIWRKKWKTWNNRGNLVYDITAAAPTPRSHFSEFSALNHAYIFCPSVIPSFSLSLSPFHPPSIFPQLIIISLSRRSHAFHRRCRLERRASAIASNAAEEQLVCLIGFNKAPLPLRAARSRLSPLPSRASTHARNINEGATLGDNK